MDNKIKDNINTILKTYDLNFGDYKFSISSVSTFEKLDDKGIKVLINSGTLNKIQTQVSAIPDTNEIYLVDFTQQSISEDIKTKLVTELHKLFNDQKKN